MCIFFLLLLRNNFRDGNLRKKENFCTLYLLVNGSVCSVNWITASSEIETNHHESSFALQMEQKTLSIQSWPQQDVSHGLSRMIFRLFDLDFGLIFRMERTKPPNDDKSKSYGLLNMTRLSREVLVDYGVFTMWQSNIAFSLITRIIHTLSAELVKVIPLNLLSSAHTRMTKIHRTHWQSHCYQIRVSFSLSLCADDSRQLSEQRLMRKSN